MTKSIHIRNAHGVKFHHDLRDHIWIYVKLTFLDVKGNILKHQENYYKNFLFDTGAQNTIISKKRALECGYDKLPVQDRITAGGLGGGTLICSRIEIPDISITNKLIIHKPSVLVPEEFSINVNILGQDILKPYSYYLDAKAQYNFFDLHNSVSR